jgi:hypothetical protein
VTAHKSCFSWGFCFAFFHLLLYGRQLGMRLKPGEHGKHGGVGSARVSRAGLVADRRLFTLFATLQRRAVEECARRAGPRGCIEGFGASTHEYTHTHRGKEGLQHVGCGERALDTRSHATVWDVVHALHHRHLTKRKEKKTRVHWFRRKKRTSQSTQQGQMRKLNDSSSNKPRERTQYKGAPSDCSNITTAATQQQ